MFHFEAVRTVIYSYISAIEEDLREIVLEEVCEQLQGEPFISENRLKEIAGGGVNIEDPAELVLGLNFSEPWEILVSNESLIDTRLSKLINSSILNLPKYVELRNQVMHSRPLDADLISEFYKFIELAKKLPNPFFKYLKKAYQNIMFDPSKAVDIEIEFDKSSDRIPHNLPVPDFDETGLVGRAQELNEISELITGPWPVITLIGEGAIGKTALALRLAYQVLDDPKFNFDTIIWVSAKTNQLMPNEIKELNNTVRNSVELLDQVGEFLGASKISDTGFAELLEYLNTFKILLIIDNLETVVDENLRNFLSQINSRDSKILLTSRIGLGDFERRYKVENLNERDAVTLLRTLAKSRKEQHLVSCSNATLVKYCNRMLNSPGFIKWYVSMVSLGASPEQALSNPKMFLDFALENVFKFLSEKATFIIKCLAKTGGDNTLSEISYLCDVGGDELRSLLLELIVANVLSLSSKHISENVISSYQISSLARFYINNKMTLTLDEQKHLNQKNKEITFERDEALADKSKHPTTKYLLETIAYRSQEDAVCGKYLKKALSYSRQGDFSSATATIEQVKQLSPDFGEVYRISAMINAFCNNNSVAQEEYETALSLTENDPVVLFWYAGFKMRNLNDTNGAIELLEMARKLDSEAIKIKIELSRALTFVGKFSEASKLSMEVLDRPDASLKEFRISADGLIQTFLRDVKSNIQNNLGTAAFNIYVKAAEIISNIPTRCFDNMVIRRVQEFLTVSSAVDRMVFDPTKKQTLLQSINQIKDRLGELEVKSSGTNTAIPKFQNDASALFVSDEAANSYVGVCKMVKHAKAFGFLYCEATQESYYFRTTKNFFVKPGQIVNFSLVETADGQKRAVIMDIKENPSLSAPIKVSLHGIQDGTLEFISKDGTLYHSTTSEFDPFYIDEEDMLGEEVTIQLTRTDDNKMPIIISNLTITEAQSLKYSLRSTIGKLKKTTGVVIKKPEHERKADGTIHIEELKKDFKFSRMSMKKPFSLKSISQGDVVALEISLGDKGVEIKNLYNPHVELPVAGNKTYNGILKASTGASYLFVIVANKWECLLLEHHFPDQSELKDLIEGTEITCKLKNADKGLLVTDVKLI